MSLVKKIKKRKKGLPCIITNTQLPTHEKTRNSKSLVPSEEAAV